MKKFWIFVFFLIVCASCKKQEAIRYAKSPWSNIQYDPPNEETVDLLFEYSPEMDEGGIEKAVSGFLDYYDGPYVENLLGQNVTLREPYTIFTGELGMIAYPIYVNDDYFASISSERDSKGYWTSQLVKDKALMEMPYKKGCYRYKFELEGVTVYSVPLSEGQEYGDFNKVIYKFSEEQLTKTELKP